ncbi:MAG TPA: F0F1 ATP synthase subunit B [Gemmatimonadales bacterium]|nr:F0F1 ATP synthase subunit B [Gemmatimonadales bacterium]
MTFGILLALQEVAEGSHAAEAGPASPFEVNFGLFFWTWIVFLVLLFLLWKFAWPQILEATVAREAKIKAQLAEAERLNAAAQAALAEATKQQAEARSTAQALLAEAKAAVEKERASAVEKIKQDQDALLERTRRDIAAERDKAIADLRREAVDLALSAAAKVIGQRLDSEADKKIVLDYLAKVEH